MAENKQYITQPQMGGNIMVSEEVFATISANAIADVEGVAGFSGKPGTEIHEVVSKKAWGKSLKVVIGEEDELYIDCSIVVAYNNSVVAVAKAVQEAVTSALESVASVTVAAVNVNIAGINRK